MSVPGIRNNSELSASRHSECRRINHVRGAPGTGKNILHRDYDCDDSARLVARCSNPN